MPKLIIKPCIVNTVSLHAEISERDKKSPCWPEGPKKKDGRNGGSSYDVIENKGPGFRGDGRKISNQAPFSDPPTLPHIVHRQMNEGLEESLRLPF